MKKILPLLLAVALIVAFCGCVADDSSAGTASTASPISVEYDEEDEDTAVDTSGTSYIELEGDSISFEGSGAAVDGSTITITAAGTYSISGTLYDGQIVVDAGDEDKVKLVLNGVDITCLTSAPIYVVSADKTVITLAAGTENFVADGDSYILWDAESDEPNAAIFSHDDLTINGEGALTVEANYNDGITSKDDLKITGGSITVNAVNDGIRGKDSVAIKDGTVTVNADGDGIQSNNDSDPEKGYISIEGGTIDINAGADGIQAETCVSITAGEIAISSGGGSSVSSSSANWGVWGMSGGTAGTETSDSAKAIKAGVSVMITGGLIDIDSSDDSIHSNDSIVISGGTIVLASGDDGIHADSTLEINGGEISVTMSYEGLESAVITINDGTILITANDDGINVAGGNDGSSINGRPGQNNFESSGNYHLYINGGYIVIDAAGDGLDSNGSVDMTGGVVIVNGPTGNGNGPLDYMGEFRATGGYLLAVGSSGMAQAPSTTSTQYSVMVTYSSAQSAGTMVHIETADGEEVLTYMPHKAYQSVVLCSAELQKGTTYTVYSGGSSTGTVKDGLYSGGTYTPGTNITSFTISGMVTFSGSSGTGMPGGDFPGGIPPDGRMR